MAGFSLIDTLVRKSLPFTSQGSILGSSHTSPGGQADGGVGGARGTRSGVQSRWVLGKASPLQAGWKLGMSGLCVGFWLGKAWAGHCVGALPSCRARPLLVARGDGSRGAHTRGDGAPESPPPPRSGKGTTVRLRSSFTQCPAPTTHQLPCQALRWAFTLDSSPRWFTGVETKAQRGSHTLVCP